MISMSTHQLDKIFKYTVYGALVSSGFAGVSGGVLAGNLFT